MASLPYVTSPGNIDKALNEIKRASTPKTVSQDFVKTILKVPGGSGDQMTTFLKKLGLANADGSPNERYRKYRNPTSSGQAIAAAIQHAYAPLYVRNEFMHELDDEGLLGLIVEETGQAHDSNPVRLISNCIKHLKKFANFEENGVEVDAKTIQKESLSAPHEFPSGIDKNNSQSIGLNLGYTINLNLPPTTDPAVFDAIFKSLKENFLRKDDG